MREIIEKIERTKTPII